MINIKEKDIFHVFLLINDNNDNIRYSLPNLINETSSNIIDKVYTHSVNGFRRYVKKCMIQKYSDTCHIINCYICNQN